MTELTMAAETVMLDNLHNELSSSENEPLLRWMEELRNLMESVQSAKEMMRALEEGGSRGSSSNLMALVYQADDLLDEILTFTKTTRFNQQDADQGTMFNTLVSPLSSCSQLVWRLNFAHKLKQTSKEIINLTYQSLTGYRPDPVPQNQLVLPQSFQLAEHKVIGRDTIRRKIITNMLQQPKTEGRTEVTIIPIVGSPGVGKSTLAKEVYNNDKVINHFDLRMWIQVTDISDEEGIIREIVESFAKRNSSLTNNNISHLGRAKQNWGLPLGDLFKCQGIETSTASLPRNQTNINKRQLQKEIEGKVYLLILDDASPSFKQWQCLKGLLARGAPGSQMLVTTRSDEVADLSKTENAEVCCLEGLDGDASYSLFKSFAFTQNPQGGYSREAELKEMGTSIARICKGVPLTIKVAASLLYGKSNDYWSSFEQDLAEHIVSPLEHVLNQSYMDLHNRLKACFTYCSLFPYDFTFNKDDLISLWNAQGFTEPQQDLCLEKAAEKYLIELSRRCFFEDVSTDDLGNIVTCKMHPIMHSLAWQHTAGVVNMYGLDSGVNNQVLDSACKHISFSCQRATSTNLAPSLLQAQRLRTLLSVKEPGLDGKLHKSAFNVFVSKLKSLRVLDLHDLGIEEIPFSVGELIHLRFLDLSKNDGLFALPKSITKLYNLQTLKLNSCPNLQRLPSNFRQLINLKRLEVDECDSLTCMPLGLEKLTQLETLNRFVVNKDCSKDMNSIGLKALEELNNLRGRLSIELTGDWETNIAEASLARLSCKRDLEELKISWSKIVSEKIKYRELLENLQPHPNLRSLSIEGYKGEFFPSWAKLEMLTCLQQLVVVSIEGCDKCEQLPPFAELPYLKKLTLRHMANVQHVEGDSSLESPSSNEENRNFFPSLQELILHNFYKLEGWRKEIMDTPRQQTEEENEEIREFKCLTKLRIWNCPNLRYMPLFRNVEDLDLCNVNQMLLEECAKKAAFQDRENDSKIRKVQIKECHNLKSFKAVRKGLGGVNCLKQLVIEKCDALLSLASELKHLQSLERLEISNCKEIDLSDDETSCMSNSNTKSWKSLKRFRHLILGGMDNSSNESWKSLKRLRHLTLREIPKMETLPEGLKHVQKLRSLWISTCPALKELPEWINHLTTLQHLRIENCLSLTRLPDGLQEVPSLVRVDITECPKLMERCRKHTGEDWHKIKHARVLLHKSWRYGLMSELGATKNTSNVRALTEVKYFIVPVVAAEAV